MTKLIARIRSIWRVVRKEIQVAENEILFGARLPLSNEVNESLPHGYDYCALDTKIEGEWIGFLDQHFPHVAPWSRERLDRWIYERLIPNGVILIKSGEQIVGCGAVCHDEVKNSGRIMYVAVAEAHRRAGLGRYIVGELSRVCTEQQCVQVTLITNPSRVAAVNMYRKLGFSQKGFFARLWRAVRMVVSDMRWLNKSE